MLEVGAAEGDFGAMFANIGCKVTSKPRSAQKAISYQYKGCPLLHSFRGGSWLAHMDQLVRLSLVEYLPP